MKGLWAAFVVSIADYSMVIGASLPEVRSSRRGPTVRSWSGRTAGFLERDDRWSSGCLVTRRAVPSVRDAWSFPDRSTHG